MTAHELARILLDGPDLPVCVIGQGSMEGFTIDLTEIKELDSVRCQKTHLESQPVFYVTNEEYDAETLIEFNGERGRIIQLS